MAGGALVFGDAADVTATTLLTSRRRRLVESAAAQVVCDDDVSDGVKDELNVVSVSGARLVTVDLLVGALVLRLELRLDVSGRLLVRLLA